jgi:hypothetical protein
VDWWHGPPFCLWSIEVARLRALVPYVRFVSKPNLIGHQWYTRGPTSGSSGFFAAVNDPEFHGRFIGNAFAHLADEHPDFELLLPTPYETDTAEFWEFTRAFEKAAPGVLYRLLFPEDSPPAGPRC